MRSPVHSKTLFVRIATNPSPPCRRTTTQMGYHNANGEVSARKAAHSARYSARSTRSSVRAASPTTRPPRPVSLASPGRRPSSWPSTRSRSTRSCRAGSRPTSPAAPSSPRPARSAAAHRPGAGENPGRRRHGVVPRLLGVRLRDRRLACPSTAATRSPSVAVRDAERRIFSPATCRRTGE
jgi:hypothetical protein